MIRFLKFQIFLVAMISPNAVGAEHYGKKVNNVQVNASNGCIYFTLDGVTEADPVAPGEPWITVASENESKQEVLSLLMMAQASKSDVKVMTSGQIVCGYAGVHYIRVIN